MEHANAIIESMPTKAPATHVAFGPKQRIIAFVLLVVIIVVVVFLLRPPARSVAAYCRIYNEQNAKLAKAKGNAYTVAVFSHNSSNPADFVEAFSKLERVAPDDIRPDVTILKKVFQTIQKDPSQALNAGIGGESAERSVTDWTTDHCGA